MFFSPQNHDLAMSVPGHWPLFRLGACFLSRNRNTPFQGTRYSIRALQKQKPILHIEVAPLAYTSSSANRSSSRTQASVPVSCSYHHPAPPPPSVRPTHTDVSLPCFWHWSINNKGGRRGGIPTRRPFFSDFSLTSGGTPQ